MSAPAEPPPESGGRPSLREMVGELWRDYPWVTRCSTVLILVSSGMNVLIAAGGGEASRWGPFRWVPDWLQYAMASDGMLTLLALAVALGVGLHLKERQLKGLLDGTDHYDIGRALAFGYFSNFLVAALLLVRMESRRQGRNLEFRMIFPRDVDDLEKFKETVEPAIRKLAGKRELEGVYKVGGSVIKRSMLIVSRATAEGVDPEEIFFDFSTTLYTLHDYYSTWNDWLEENDKPPMSGTAIAQMQERQVQAFKRHLVELSRSEVGLGAVRHLGLGGVDDLSRLFQDHFRHVDPAEMLVLLGGAGEAG